MTLSSRENNEELYAIIERAKTLSLNDIGRQTKAKEISGKQIKIEVELKGVN